MKKLALLITTFMFIAGITTAQNRVFTKTGKIEFDATAPSSPETIHAVNQKATSVLDLETGAMQFAVLMKAFHFEKALMQEHFNENYVESDKFPKADFKGSISNFPELNLSKDGMYDVSIKGTLTIHGVKKEVEAKGKLTVKGGSVTSGISEFVILLSDFNIEVPTLVRDKVNKEAKITVKVDYEPMKSS
ncbi:MAG: YceI family protein [Bacteroidetes bacterium]|nr:MAG: YceI family protein [Bacteroidota bacterium]REK05279.1 MAG: YceI family protein [Bacteroidota bacterium]REK32684.1 MAG: YceI family protein [Bacteroidota bacterium]REK48869.1 MAG: YceI family protein [Bacteroidota bacterium]